MLDGTDRGCDLGVAPGVQDLQGDLAATGVHGRNDRPMLGDLCRMIKDRSGSFQPTLFVGREAAGDDQSNTALGALCIKAGHAFVGTVERFQPRVHGAHQQAVPQRHEAEIERLQQARKSRHGLAAGGLRRSRWPV